MRGRAFRTPSNSVSDSPIRISESHFFPQRNPVMKTSPVSRPQPSARRGFTLVELLAVIAILSILMAFLIPAVMNARRAARIVQVKTEMGNLDAAIATFKQEFGIEPPSRITLQPSGVPWTGWDPDSAALIQRMWPQFDPLNSGATWTSAVTLNGAECLVFFLGGVTDSYGAPIGFSRNPASPFSTSGSSRIRPFYQFSVDRLIDLNSNGFREYRDPLGATNIAPYVYFSSYDGSGYPFEIDDTPPTCGYFCGYDRTVTPPQPIIDQSCDTYWYCTDNWSDSSNSGLMMRPYYTTVPDIADSTNSSMTTPPYRMQSQASNSRPQLPSGHQIICAGFDGRLGFGGLSASDELIRRDLNGDGDFLDLFEDRDVERDNITNFSNGVLAP